jgi:hypothetical protein
MPPRISREIESKIVKLYLQGIDQTEISKKCNVSQSTVSGTIARLKKDASNTSLDGVSASWSVHDEVDELRSLSVVLRKAKIGVDEAEKGYRLAEELEKIGGNLGMLDRLLTIYKTITPKGFSIQEFVKATVEMIQLEKEFRIGYKDLSSTYAQKHSELNKLNETIGNKTVELAETIKKKDDAKTDLERYLNEKRLKLDEVNKALQIRESLEKAGLSLEKGEVVGNMLRIFGHMIESKGLTSETAAVELQRFLIDARNLEQARKGIESAVHQSTITRDSLNNEVQSLRSEKSRLSLENKFLKDAIENVLELRKKYGIGVDEIAKIKGLAEKYGPPASILQALDTYRSLKNIEEQKAILQGSVEELTRNESLLKGKIKAIGEELAEIPAKTDKSVHGVESSLEKLSKEVQDLETNVKNASKDVLQLKNDALNAGREISAVESQVKAYKLTSKLIEFVAEGKGEEADVVAFTMGLLSQLSQWVDGHPKYSQIKEQLESLKETVERQLILGQNR